MIYKFKHCWIKFRILCRLNENPLLWFEIGLICERVKQRLGLLFLINIIIIKDYFTRRRRRTDVE